jgi:hypothetical protein
MEQGRMRMRSAAWGGTSLGIGTLAYALCSPSYVGCSTNLVVLTHGTVTARGCAAYSTLARLGFGLMVLGTVLLFGSFFSAIRTRREVPMVTGEPVADTPLAVATPVVVDTPPSPPAETPPTATVPVVSPVEEPPARRVPARVGPLPPGGDNLAHVEPGTEIPVSLPPGWYGNPNNPDHPVQWWDGRKLVDRPARPGR